MLSALLTIAGFKLAAVESAAANNDVVHPIKIFRITAAGEHSVRYFQGQTQASDRTSLAFRVSGQLVEFPALSGQTITKGELLARLDAVEYELIRDQAEAKYRLALVEFKRTERLVKDQLVSQQMHDQNRVNLARAKAELEQAQADVGYTQLKAPFDGVISRTDVENWDYVTANQTILSVQGDGMTDVLIQVPQNVITQISRKFALDLQAIVRFAAQPQYSYVAEVSEVDMAADPETLSYQVTMTFPTPTEFNVSNGMTVVVGIDFAPLNAEKADYFVVPASVLVEESSGAKVWLVNPESMTVVAKPVTILERSGDKVKINGELATGDMLALTGAHLLSEGMQVQEWIRERGL
jgi:RND family efflux transporter MFP subunit